MPKKSHKKLLRKGEKSGKKSQRGNANRSNSTQPLSMMKGGRKVLEYKVLQYKDLTEFEREVYKKIKEGWKLEGGVSRDMGALLQAITKEIEIESYKVEDVKPIGEIKLTDKTISKDKENPNDWIVHLTEDKDINQLKKLYPGLDIKITTTDNKTFQSKIKYVSTLYNYLRFEISSTDNDSILTSEFNGTLTIDAFQKIILYEDLPDEIDIGSEIIINNKGKESGRTIKAKKKRKKKEIVLETPLETSLNTSN